VTRPIPCSETPAPLPLPKMGVLELPLASVRFTPDNCRRESVPSSRAIITHQTTAMSISRVCLSVRSHISKTVLPKFTKLLCVLPMVMVRSSSGGVAICHVLRRRLRCLHSNAKGTRTLLPPPKPNFWLRASGPAELTVVTLTNRQPVQLMRQLSDTGTKWRLNYHHTDERVLDTLKTVEVALGAAVEKTVAVVETCIDDRPTHCNGFDSVECQTCGRMWRRSARI